MKYSTLFRAGRALAVAGVMALTAMGSLASAADFESAAMASTRVGVPEGMTVETWNTAAVSLTATADGAVHHIALTGENLVPNGLYTVWYMAGNKVGPAGGLPDNEFKADDAGTASVSFDVPANNEYNMAVIAYHADGQTHGESPGAMGTLTFEHLAGPWPGPAGMK